MRPAATLKSSQFGRILLNSRGFVLYGFTRDQGAKRLRGYLCARVASVHREEGP